ncbi:MAG TPA: hypothetical protein VK815_15690 [Candidatus Acidoferrales bacterium]|jgi:hypothetical protein|nr:hypothetical protein [Candidatus Acidoferrales bacterium]
MEANQNGALTLVRIIGVMLVVASILELGLYWAECAYHKPEPLHVEVLPIIFRSIPAVTGIVVLIKSSTIAEWVAEKLDL